jgi:rhodanese-related sulfurtransferase
MSAEEMLEEARRLIHRVTPLEAERLIADGAVVVDLRCGDERRRTGMIPGSIAVARSVLEWRADPESPWRDDRLAEVDAHVLLVCEHGYSSSLAAVSLLRLGFRRAGDIAGGMERWLEEGLPVVPVGRTPDVSSIAG